MKFGATVVIPLSLPNLYTSDKLKTKLKAEQNAFLIVYKDKANKKHAEVVIKIPDEHSKPGAFSGITQVLDWQGNLIQSYKYTYDTELKMNTSLRVQENGPRTETEAVWCVAVDWISCAQMDGYPTFCQYNYTTYYCFTENSSTPGGGTAPSGGGSCCGSYGSITGGNDSYPLAKEIAAIKFDTSIKLINVYQCLTTVFNTLREQRYGFWGKVIYDFSNEMPFFKWQIKQGVLSSETTSALTTNDPYIPTLSYTMFNTTYLNNATNISIARTMLHEAAHAYLNYKLYGTQSAQKQYPAMYVDWVTMGNNMTPAQHQEIARSFINGIANALKIYGQSLGIHAYDTYYMDLAWGGLTGTIFFNALSDADKERIIAINQAEATGETVIRPNGTLVVPLGTNICN